MFDYFFVMTSPKPGFVTYKFFLIGCYKNWVFEQAALQTLEDEQNNSFLQRNHSSNAEEGFLDTCITELVCTVK